MEVSYIGKEFIMNMKRILVLVMTFAMLVTTFAPTLGVFADYVAGNGDNGKDGTLDYVSIGDSMTNGIGMPGYDATGKNGYLEEAPDAYPSQFAGWLESFTGKEVNLTQLATSAARIEDVYYMLTKGTEKEFTPDYWTVRELLTNPDRWGKTGAARGEENWDKHMDTNNTVANVFQSSVANADVISLATGNGNFGVFFMGRVMNLVGFGSAEELALDNEKYAHMTVENALELCGANEEVKELVMGVYNDAEAYLVEAGMPSDLIVAILNYLVYTTASYVVTYMNVIDYIAEVNSDATVIILPLINNGLDFNFNITLHGITKSFNAGDFLGALYTPINAFMAAYTTVANETGASDNTYYYAELPVDENGETIQVETFAQAFETLYAPIEVLENGTVVYPESRKFCHSRFYPEIQSFVMPIIFGGSEADYYGAFDLNDIIAYETAQAKGTAAFAVYAAENAGKVQLLAYYLGIVDAVLSSMKAVANVNLDEISVPAGETFSMFSILGPVVGGLQSEIPAKVAENAEAIAPRLAYELIAANITPVLEPYFSNPEFLYVFGADLEIYGDDSVEKTLAMIELAVTNDARFDLNGDLKAMKAALVDGYNQIANGLELLSMAVVLPETLSEALTSVGLLEALLALYGRLKLAWGLSAHPSAAGHDTLTQSLVDAYKNEYTTKDETIENIKETIDLAIKVTDKAYQEAYDYVDEAGYINKVVSIINRVINRLNRVDLSDNTMTEEFRVLLDKEIEATIATLKEIKDVLVNDKAEDLAGLVATVRGLMDDALTHLNNIYALCAQAGIDVNQLVIIPALKEALVILETELIPALKELVEEFVEAVVAHVTEKAEELYNYALGLSKEVYLQLVALVVRVQLHVEEKVEEIVDVLLNQYFVLVGKLEAIYGNVQDAVNTALKVIGAVADKIVEVAGSVENALEIAKKVLTTAYDILVEAGLTVKEAFEVAVEIYTVVVEFLVENAESVEKALEIAGKAFEYVLEVAAFVYENAEEIYAIATKVYATLVDVIAKVYNIVETSINVYNFVYDLLVDVFGSIENAICIAGKVCKLVVEFIQNTPELLENAYQLYCDIYDLIVEVYGKTADAEECAKAVYTYVVGVITVALDDIKNAIYGASNGDYEITLDSYYVALGNADYVEELAGMLYLESKYAQYGLAGDYTADLEKADLVTVKFNNGEFFEFAYAQIMGVVAQIIKTSDVYNKYGAALDMAIAELPIDLNAQTVELDWSKYLDAETIAILQERLDKVAEDVTAAGLPVVYELDLAPVLSGSLDGVTVNETLIVEIPVAELIAFGVESLLYAYAETAARVINTLGTIYAVAPEATVVITGINNPLAIYAESLEGFVPGVSKYIGILDEVVEILNLPLYGYAVANEKTIFVGSDNAEDIYAALHAHCGHAYDNACDTTCNICGETRTVGAHVYDNACDTTCNVCGAVRTVDAHVYDNDCDTTCNVCGATRTVGAHVYDNACDATCNVCGATRTPADHVYDDCADDTCNVCGATRVAPGHVYDDKYDSDCNVCGATRDVPLRPWVIIAIAVGSVVVACAAGAAAYWFFLKKKSA